MALPTATIGQPDPGDLFRHMQTADYVDDFDAIGEAEIRSFHECGYLAVKSGFSSAEVASATAGLLALLDGRHPGFKGVQFERGAASGADLSLDQKQNAIRKFYAFVAYDERLAAIAQHPKLIDLLHRLIGEPPLLFQDMALLKPPRIGREKPWHQDLAYFNMSHQTTVVGVWIALDPATAENGCMHVIPGSHREGPVLHFQRRDWQICDTLVHSDRDVMVPLAPGGVLFFHGLIHHGTPANRSVHRRRALQFHYKPASAAATDEKTRLAVFGGEGQGVEC